MTEISGMKVDNFKENSESNRGSPLAKQISKKPTGRRIYDEKSLKRLVKHLKRLRNLKCQDREKESCIRKVSREVRTDTQVKLRCHQLPNVVQELRKALIRQDWDEAVTLLMVLCHPGLKLYMSIILRTCCILFFNHPNSNAELLQDFIRCITGYILEEDVHKFVRILFALRQSAITMPETGKYVRKTDVYKVTRDFEFENL